MNTPLRSRLDRSTALGALPWLACTLVLALVGCDETHLPDAGTDAAMPGDGGRDAGSSDGSVEPPLDASPDAGPTDSGPIDAGPPCGATTDTETVLSSGMHVLHQNGQTLVSWRDRAEGEGGAEVRYRLLRSAAPIDASNVDSAEVVVRLIPNHSGQLFGSGLRSEDRLDPSLPMARMAESMPPLPVWSGLWASTARVNGCAYFAVQATDREDVPTEAITPGVNATTDPVAELVGEMQPILHATSEERAAGATPTIVTGTPNLPLRVVLHASGGTVSTWGDHYQVFGDPSMGFVDGVPNDMAVQASGAGGEPHLKLSSTDRIWRPEGPGLVQTHWFGYVVPDVDGDLIAHPYTENRLRWMIPWAIERYDVDPNRVICEGGSMGANGCLSFGIRHPDLFAATYPNRPRIYLKHLIDLDFVYYYDEDGATLPDGTPWETFRNAATYVRAHPEDLPFIGWNTGRHDFEGSWAEAVDFIDALESNHHGYAFAWNDGDHSTGVVTGAVVREWYPPGLFARNLSYPAFSNSSINDNMGTGDLSNGDLTGGINLGFVWTLDEDTATNWAIDLQNDLAEAPMTVDVTPRNTQAFHTTAGETVSYTLRRGGGAEVASGTVTADEHGLVTLESVELLPDTVTAIRFTR
ncbi:MAG: hypothetical protein AB8I08_19790 [Sandaracinaceae bacterium]